MCQVPASLGTGFCRGPWWWMLDSSAGYDPRVEGRCSVLGRSEKCPQSAVSSLLSSTAGLQQFRHSWRQGLELQSTVPWLSSVSETRFQALGVGEKSSP